MKTDKLTRLQATGWKVGSAEDFLQLSDEEARLVALKLSLISAVKKSRIKRKLSQTDLAQRMKSSQSRIAKIEAGDPSVSLDLRRIRDDQAYRFYGVLHLRRHTARDGKQRQRQQ